MFTCRSLHISNNCAMNEIQYDNHMKNINYVMNMHIHKAISLLQLVQHREKKILYKHTSDFAGPTKNSKTTSVENQLTPLHQNQVHQGIFQNQRVFCFVSVLDKNYSENCPCPSCPPRHYHRKTNNSSCMQYYFHRHFASMWLLVLWRTSTKRLQAPNTIANT
jgi:hypothetical protein